MEVRGVPQAVPLNFRFVVGLETLGHCHGRDHRDQVDTVHYGPISGRGKHIFII